MLGVCFEYIQYIRDIYFKKALIPFYKLKHVFKFFYFFFFLGFICPVHTPDGAPCGLLNHLTMNCIVTKHPDPKLKNAIPIKLLELGMTPLASAVDEDWKNSYTIILDGRILGLIEDKTAVKVANELRVLKINEEVINFVNH